MPSTTKSIEAKPSKLCERHHSRKSMDDHQENDYEMLKKKASDLASELEDITYEWARSPTGEEYGLLAEIIREEGLADVHINTVAYPVGEKDNLGQGRGFGAGLPHQFVDMGRAILIAPDRQDQAPGRVAARHGFTSRGSDRGG